MSASRHEHYLIRVRRQLDYLLKDVDRVLNNSSMNDGIHVPEQIKDIDNTERIERSNEHVTQGYDTDHKHSVQYAQNNECNDFTTSISDKSNVEKKEPPIVGLDIGTNDIIDAFCTFCILFIIVSWIIRISLRLWLKYKTDSRGVCELNQNYPIKHIDSTRFKSDKYTNENTQKLIADDSLSIQTSTKKTRPIARKVYNENSMKYVPHRSFQDRIRNTIRNLTGSSNGITNKPFAVVTK